MRVQYQSNVIKQPVFQNKCIKNCAKAVENQLANKTLPINAKAMMIYNSLKPYRMYVTVEEISALKNLEGQEFILQVYEFITQKQGLTEKSRPYFQLLHSMNNEFDMCYSPIYNIIWGDLSKLSKHSKDDVYALIRHELQHFYQFSSTLRHETIGEEAVERMGEKYVSERKKEVTVMLDKYTDEQLSDMFNEAPELSEYYRQIRKLRCDDSKGYDAYFEREGEKYRQDILNIQQQLKRDLGVIPADSPLTSKIRQDLDEVLNVGYIDANGNVDIAKYKMSKIEQEARRVQNAGLIDFATPSCGFKMVKESLINFPDAEEDFFVKVLDTK